MSIDSALRELHGAVVAFMEGASVNYELLGLLHEMPGWSRLCVALMVVNNTEGQ